MAHPGRVGISSPTCPVRVILASVFADSAELGYTACRPISLPYDVELRICEKRVGLFDAWCDVVMWGALLPCWPNLVWNYGYRQATTASRIVGGAEVQKSSARTREARLGFGLSVPAPNRPLDSDRGILYIRAPGFPALGRPKRQQLADKIMATVCLPGPPCRTRRE